MEILRTNQKQCIQILLDIHLDIDILYFKVSSQFDLVWKEK